MASSFRNMQAVFHWHLIPTVRSVWRQLTEPGPDVVEPQRRRLRLLMTLQIVLLAIGTIGLAFIPQDTGRFNNYAVIGVGLAVIGSAYLLSRRRHQQAAIMLTIGAVSVSVAVVTLEIGNIDVLNYLLLSVFASSLLLPSRSSALVLAAHLALILFLASFGFRLGITDVSEQLFVVGSLGFFALVAARLRERDFAQIADQSRSLALGKERLDGLIATATDIIVSADDSQRIVLFNEAAERAFGYTAAEIIGRPLDVLLPARFVEAHRAHVRRFAADPAERILEHRLEIAGLRKDGSEIPLEGGMSKIGQNGNTLLTLMASDITQRKLADAAIRRRADEFSALYETSFALSAHYELLPLLKAIGERVRSLLNAYGSVIYLLDHATQELVLQVPINTALPAGLRVPLDRGVCGYVATKREPLIVDDYATWSGRLRDVSGSPVRAIAAVPLLYGGELIGVLEATEQGPRTYTADDIRLLTLFAAQAAGAVHAAGLLDEARRRNGQLAAISAFGQKLSETLDLDQVYLRLRESITELFPDVPTITVTRLDWDSAQFEWLFAYNDGQPMDVSSFPNVPMAPASNLASAGNPAAAPVAGPQSEAVHTRQAVVVGDLQARTARSQHREHIGSDSLPQSALFMPMLVNSQVTGILQLQSYQRDRFSRADVEQLSFIASAAAIAIENARLFAETANRVRELDALVTVSAALREVSTVAEIRGMLLRATLEVMQAQAGTFFLLDRETQLLNAVAFEGYPANMRQLSLKPGEGLAGRCLQSGQPIYVADISSDARVATPGSFAGLHKALCQPLRDSAGIVGVLLIAFQSRGAPTAHEISLMSAIVEIAGSTLQRAELHEQTTRQLDRMATLNKVGLSISSSFDLRQILNVLLGELTTKLHIDAAAVMTLNPHLQTLEMAANRGFRSKAIDTLRLRLGQGFTGQAVLERRMATVPDLREVPDAVKHNPFMAGEDFVTYIVVPLVAKGQIKGVLKIFQRSALTPGAEWTDFLQTLASQVAIAIDVTGLFVSLERSNIELTQAYDETIEGWSAALDLRDRETEGHTLRVTELTLKLAGAMHVSETELVQVKRGALLHDIGKMGVPDAILLKPGPLTDEEWVQMRRHPQLAYDLLSRIRYLRPALDIPYCHHEKWDGTGYPRELSGEQIPLVARLFAIIDVWDALRSDRPYRKAWPEEKVRAHIRSLSGTHFDPQVVEAFLNMPL